MKPEAVDAAELILNTLREHEKRLDEIVFSLEGILRILEGKHMKELDRLIERLEKAVAAQEKGRGMFGARMKAMWILIDAEAQDLLRAVKGLAKWCHDKRNLDPDDPRFMLLVYAEGLRDGMAKVLEKMGVKVK